MLCEKYFPEELRALQGDAPVPGLRDATSDDEEEEEEEE